MESKLKDSGERREFSTGSVRDGDEGKGRFDLLSAVSLTLDAKHMQKGANKYADRNWEKGQPLSQYINSALRHITKAMMGLTDEPHMDAAAWNINAYRHTLMMIEAGALPEELDDRPSWGPGVAEQIASRLFPDFLSESRDPHQLELYES